MDNKLFLGSKISPTSIAALSKTADMEEFSARETVFDTRRSELQYQFRSSSKSIEKICHSGFWKSYLHLANQFKYISRAEDLVQKVRSNLPRQLDVLEQYLKYVDKSCEILDKIAILDSECAVEYDGSTLYKDISIMVTALFSSLFFCTQLVYLT